MSKLDYLLFAGKTKVKRGIENLVAKRDGDSQLVVALVLIAIAVGLCILFRNQIKNAMTDLLNTITSSINALSNGVVE